MSVLNNSHALKLSKAKLLCRTQLVEKVTEKYSSFYLMLKKHSGHTEELMQSQN